MGQGYSLNAFPTTPNTLETTELSDLTFEKPLGGARFLRSFRARHQHGIVVVKVCGKNNTSVSFKKYARLLKDQRHLLKGISNVLPYQRIRETSTLGLLVRQYIHSSLYDRVSIRPFLENIEKKWIAFQLLCAVRDCHAQGVFHGDIKSENVLVTSWGWVYLTDFASAFKPVYLPEDNPAEFSFYYDTSARRTCYVAPERFYSAGEKPADEIVQWNMDIFSLGCVIAELFTEAPTFTLSQLFRYRKGEYDPTVALLNKVDNEHVRSLISSMIRLNPEDRWHAQDYLDEFKGKAFPLYFYQHLHTLMQEITSPAPSQQSATQKDTNNGISDDRIDRLYDDFETLSMSLGYDKSEESRLPRLPGTGRGLFPLQVDVPNSRHTAHADPIKSVDNGTFILLNVVTASLRSTARASSKVRACELLLAFAERLPDEAKLDRILPYIMPLLEDENDMVLVAALRTMTQLLALVTVISPVNSFIFTQYVFPRLQNFVKSSGFKSNAIVRATYAACLATLADTASRFLDMMQALKADRSLPSVGKGPEGENDSLAATSAAYDAVRLEVVEQFEGQTKVFLTDNDTAVRRAFLSSVPSLCVFFGESRAADVILSHLNTYLNDPDWLLKCAFFKTVVGVAVYIGGARLEDFILPLMLQALTDPQEFVIEQALRSLASMAEMGLLQRAKTWELIDTVARFEVHPNMWIKEAASHFVSAATTYLSMADVRILVAPLINPYLKVPVGTLTESELLDALKKPLPRTVLDMALQWAAKIDKSLFWKQAKDSKQLSYRGTNTMPPVSTVADLGPKSLAKVPKTDEDEQWLGRLRNAGMRSEDEIKLLAFREYLWRAAQRIKREAPSVEGMYDDIVELKSLKVTPQTVIFDGDVDIYRHRTQVQTSVDQGIAEAMLEAANSPPSESPMPADVNKAIPLDIKSTGDGKVGPLKLPDLRRQASNSGDSLSASPSSGIGLLGKDSAPMKPRSTAGRLLKGADLRNKSLAEVATDDTNASGRLNTPPVSSRRASPSNANERRRGFGRTASSRAGHNYAGNDPTVLRLLDAVYIDNFPTDAAEFGPIVQPLKRGPIPSSSTHAQARQWRPEGQLVAMLSEHSSRITRIIVSPDHSFFVTASEDSYFRIWDTSRFERNVTHRSRFRQSIGSGIKITSACFIEATYSFVLTGSDGSVHFYKVPAADKAEQPDLKYSNTQAVRTWQIPTASSTTEFAVWCEHFRGESGSTLVIATNLDRILAVDLRYMSIIFDLRNPAQHGTPISFCLGRRHDWLLVGTTHGVLDLWDLRFRLRLRSWAFPAAAPVTRLQLHPSRKSAKRNRICVSGGTARGEVTVWDIEKVICHEIYRPAHTNSKERLHARDYELRNLDDESKAATEGLLSRVTDGAGATDAKDSDLTFSSSVPTSAAYAVFGLNMQSEDSENQASFAVTGGPDNKVRFWDCERLEGCRVVNGAVDEGKPEYTISNLSLDTKVISEKQNESKQQATQAMESNKVAGGSPKHGLASPSSGAGSSSSLARYETIRLSARSLLQGHLDLVTEVAVVERPFGMVVSGDRAGRVFVYQ